MADSQAFTAAAEHLDRRSAAMHQGRSLLVRIGNLLKRGYERACSAIFDADGDCMRL